MCFSNGQTYSVHTTTTVHSVKVRASIEVIRCMVRGGSSAAGTGGPHCDCDYIYIYIYTAILSTLKATYIHPRPAVLTHISPDIHTSSKCIRPELYVICNHNVVITKYFMAFHTPTTQPMTLTAANHLLNGSNSLNDQMG